MKLHLPRQPLRIARNSAQNPKGNSHEKEIQHLRILVFVPKALSALRRNMQLQTCRLVRQRM
jgi:hypothetical protein